MTNDGGENFRHPQLKNFISAADHDILYYASEKEVYALHTPSHRRQRVAVLDFTPQCLGAGHGWVCLGGLEKGHCAFVNVRENGGPFNSFATSATNHAPVDALLPLDLSLYSRTMNEDYLNRRPPNTGNLWRFAKVHYHELGTSIVNSVTVHNLRSGRKGLQDDVVAVLTNNDHSVRIFSLNRSLLLKTLEFPTLMNHATISPDGRMILACGDEPRAFFCRRKELAGFAVDGDLQYARYEWQEMAEPILTIAVPWDTCFATAFSSSGHICAVASQAGTIIIFDTSLVRDDMEADEAVVKVLKSSRPCLDSDDVRGAVRSMAFSPEPWDLFAWAEHHGRVCVTDLRDSFHSRQTIEVDVQDPDLHRIEPIDEDEKFSTVQQRELQIERLFLQRHQDSLNTQDTSSVVHDVTNYMELAAERRRMQRNLRDSGAVDSIYSGPSGLTEEERQMLESLRTERQEQTNRETEARAVAERASGAHSLAPIGSGSSTRNRDVNSSTHNLSSAPSMSRSISIHQYLRERNSERRGTAEPRAHQPRVRRSSVALSTSNPSNSSRLSTGSTNAAATTTLVGTSYRPNHSIRDYSSSFHDPPALEDPWHTISAAMANHTGPPGSQPIHRELDRELQRQRDRYHERERERQRDRDAVEVSFTTFERRIQQSARSERQRDTRLRQVQTQIRNEDAGYGEYELDVLRRMEGERGRGRGIGEDGDGSGAGAGVGMMGIQWSSDGRLLYVGTEEGILEYRVNLAHRKIFPASAFR